MAYNTVGSVVQRAVELAQLDSGFLPLGRQYYNLVINDQTTSFDFPFYRTQLADTLFVPGQTSYSLPTDYSRSDTCYLVDTNGNTNPIIITSKYRFDRLRNSTITGDPSVAYIDIGANKIYFNCSPNAVRYFRLTYFRLPVQIDESGGNDADVIDFENPMAFIYLIAASLMDYNDDERADTFMKKGDSMMRDNKLNAWDEDNDPRVELGPSFRAGNRPIRGGGQGPNF